MRRIPFASILEGARNASWDFSVKAAPAKDNRVAGGMLCEYYVDDRMLAWDKGRHESTAETWLRL
ncbi:hypothetical protein [Streptomyces pseudogriseolus]|uniref:hypothetical protein n=1 Tax=Streptomyces pseudogriseolus TaxID=36817 RepID=UPI003FA1E9DD